MKVRRIITRSFFIASIILLSSCSKDNLPKRSNDLDSLAIYKGITINSLDVGGKARLQAAEDLKSTYEKELENKKRTLTYEEGNFTYSLKELGYYYDYDKATKEAFAYAREGNDEDRLAKIEGLKKEKLNFEMPFSIDEEVLSKTLADLNDKVKVDAKGGSYIYDNEKDKVVASPGTPGKGIDIDKAKEDIKKDLSEDVAVVLQAKELLIDPNIEKNADRVNGIIGQADTNYNANFWSRAENIRLSTSTISGTVIPPGGVFSFNDIVGDTTYEKGYKEAIVLQGTKEVPGLGGGVCQTSTTIYQAALKAGLEILERSPHTMEMPYSRGGLDAAIEYAYGLDMKFRNNYDFPILIKGSCYYGPEDGRETVEFQILGDTSVKDYEISLISEQLSYTPFSTEKIVDPDLSPGQTEVKVWGVAGEVYAAYRKNEKTGEVSYLGESYYPVINQVEKVGPES